MGLHDPFGHLQQKLWQKERPRVKTGNLTPDHKKLGIDPTSMHASGMQYVVGKLLMRATTLLQTSSRSNVLSVIGKVLKCRCPKWPRIGHLDICSPSYGQKKGRESNWQFDFRPQKVGNWPLPDVCRWSVMRRWKALKESYNFGLDLTPIRGRSQELWVSKVPGVQPGTVSGLQLGSPGKKSHLDVAPTE